MSLLGFIPTVATNLKGVRPIIVRPLQPPISNWTFGRTDLEKRSAPGSDQRGNINQEQTF